MKKLNNKGITTVEIIVCFIIVIVLVVTMYSTVSSYRNKQILESQKEKLITYINTYTKTVQDELASNKITSVVITEENDGAAKLTYTATITLEGGEKRKIKVVKQTASSADSTGYNSENTYYCYTGKITATNDYDTYCSKNREDLNVAAPYVPNSSDVNLCRGFISASSLTNSQLLLADFVSDGKINTTDCDALETAINNASYDWNREIIEVTSDKAETVTINDADVSDKFEIYYGPSSELIKYPIPDFGDSKNDFGNTKKDLRISYVSMTNDNNVFNLKIDFTHPTLGNKYRINIVAPINFYNNTID